MLKSLNLDSIELDVVGVSYDYPSGFEDNHSHSNFAQIMYSVRGAMTVVTQEGRWVLPPQRALWIPAEVIHSTIQPRPVSMRTLYIRKSIPGIPNWKDCQLLQVSPLIRELILECVKFEKNYLTKSPTERLVRVLLDHLKLLNQNAFHLPEPVDPRALKASNIMKENIGSSSNIKMIAQAVGASERTLERLFSSQCGMGVSAWRQRLRLMIALEYLAAGETVNTTADAVGYENTSSFIAVFKSVFGCTPSKYYLSN